MASLKWPCSIRLGLDVLTVAKSLRRISDLEAFCLNMAPLVLQLSEMSSSEVSTSMLLLSGDRGENDPP